MTKIEDKIKEVFDGFEPEVQSRWDQFESKLDASSFATHSEMLSRVRVAERFAIGATVVAAGLTFWMVSPTILSSPSGNDSQTVSNLQPYAEEKVVSGVEDKPGGMESTALGEVSTDVSSTEVQTRAVYQESSARTSTTVRVSGDDRDVNEATRTVALSDSESESIDLAQKSSRASKATGALKNELEAATAASLMMLSSEQEACEGTEVAFALEGKMEQGSILWNFGDGAFSQESTPKHVFDRPGTYDITVSVRSHENGIIRTKSIEDMIVVRPKPEAEMDWEFTLNTGKGVGVKLLDKTREASSSTWLLFNQGLEGSQIMIKEPTTLPVNLVVSNAYGCQDVALGNIEINDRHEAGAPAIFSPNGDGRYDTFLPEMANVLNTPWVFSVFDRSNQLVFKSENTEEPWRGELRGGGSARIGERFFWSLVRTKPDGSKSIASDEIRIDG